MKNICLLLFSIALFSTCRAQKKAATTLSSTDSFYVYKKPSTDGIGKFYQGREISFIMGAAGSDWLERDTRNLEENTNLAIENITLPANATIADIGAGTGFYSFRLAQKVPKGKVYAVDVQDEMIEYLNDKKRTLKDSVVTVVKGNSFTPNLPANSIDLAIMVDVYHELEYPHEMLQAIKLALKPTGKILLIEYRGEDPTVPIKPLHKTTVTQMNRELLANGFTLDYKGDFLPIQHFLLYKK